MQILCVEDNPLNMRLIRKILETDGYQVQGAIDGKTGLQMAHEHHPAIILMDINLPDIDGIEVTKQLKEDPKFQNTLIIAVTANAMVGDRNRYIEAGCDDYVAKPISRSELLGKIKQFLVEPVAI